MSLNRSSQQGVALIVVLVIVAIATVAASQLAFRQRLSIQQSTNQIFHDQAERYIRGAEYWAKSMLAQDLADSDTDNLNEIWAAGLPVLEVPEGSVNASVVDLQGRVNINNLAIATEQAQQERVQAQLIRLLEQLEVPSEILAAWIDWTDQNADPQGFSGAEDDFYSRLKQPYLVANRFFVDKSELRLVRGVNAEIYARIAPHLTVLPEAKPVNINTADLAVLVSLGLNALQAQETMRLRLLEPFEKNSDLVDRLQLPPDVVNAESFAVSSSYFELETWVRIGGRDYRQYSVLQRRGTSQVEVIRRSHTRS